MTRVSIVIPCFNGADMVHDAVKSALAQTHDEVEVIVVDDGSTDPVTLSALARISAAGGVAVVRQENRGLSGARNSGIAAATGDYILPLDHDDELYPSYASKAAAVLDARGEVGIVYARAERFGATNGEWLLADFDMGQMLLGNQIFASAMFRRVDWQTVGGYSTELRNGYEDYDLWLSILGLEREVVRLDEILFRYRDTEASMLKSVDHQVHVDAFAYTFSKNASLYARHADKFAAAVIWETEQWGMLAHFKGRYGRLEDAISRLGAMRRRLRR